MPEEPAIRFVGDLERLVIQPGDQFVLTTDRPLTRDMHDRISQRWADFSDAKLLILDGGIKLGAINVAVERVDRCEQVR
jgi:hypothetical protein